LPENRRSLICFQVRRSVALAHIFTLAQFANALALASLLTLLATGLALVFGLRDVMNFAHGSLFMLGAYLAYSVSGLLDFWAALIVVPIALGLIGVVFEYAAFRPLRHRSQMDVALLRTLAELTASFSGSRTRADRVVPLGMERVACEV